MPFPTGGGGGWRVTPQGPSLPTRLLQQRRALGERRCRAWPLRSELLQLSLEHLSLLLTLRGVRVSLSGLSRQAVPSSGSPHHHHCHSLWLLSLSSQIRSRVWVFRPCVCPWGLRAGQGFWLVLLQPAHFILTVPWGSPPSPPLPPPHWIHLTPRRLQTLSRVSPWSLV